MQQQQQTGNQQIMPQPPQVLTVKDELYLKDMLSWNLLAAKKANFFAEQCQDPEIQQSLQHTCAMHERHYHKFQQLLDHHATSANQMN
ncbi:hypothetical protein B0H94_10828 [Salsuginibacillus halophilus]|uniref:Coat F domain-containing protein n=1 Tax=Salsuginibacillus halophilus TaxID=517424 RepID=A0A2P8HDW6_9BACI|nr:spore coat protein [Salsuginibacillus halophilus]PSL44418.1 hypothetical protein B0H94_10828 [Salsuginibacillus halophilus]